MILRDVRNNKIKTGIIVTCFFCLVALFIYFISLYFFESTWIAVIFGLTFSFISAFTSYYNSDKIVLSLNKARPATKDEDLKLVNILRG